MRIKLAGGVPSNWYSGLPNLKKLLLSDNQLSGIFLNKKDVTMLHNNEI